MIHSLKTAFSGRFITEMDAMQSFLVDWRDKWHGKALAVAQPDTTQDVAAVVRWCVHHRVPIVPQGGNTSMSGGAVPDASGEALVLSLTRLNRMRDIDVVNNTITVEAGLVLQNLQSIASENNRLYPLSLAAEGSCTVGGNLATNAGGVAVLRYGNTRDLCLGLEVVTAQGEVWDGLRGLRKDNSGYDLRDLFIGSEGTLGIITAATMKLFPTPAAKVTAWAGVNSIEQALKLLGMAQENMAAKLTAFELISDNCVNLIEEQFPNLRWPLDSRTAWAVLLEVSDPISESEGRSALESLLETAFDDEIVLDAAVASNLTQARDFWALRENMSEAQAKAGKNIKHDISVPISRIPDFIKATDKQILNAFPELRMIVFGHLGDGNLHYNISPKLGDRGDSLPAIEAQVNRIAHDAVVRFGGSISAEHGLGVLRREEAARFKSPVELQMMKAIKTVFDPLGLLNPGKSLPL